MKRNYVLGLLASLAVICVVFMGISFLVELPGERNPLGKARVVVSIEPQAFFVQKIAGDLVDIEVLVPSGKEPETYSPSLEKIRNFARSQVYFRVGFPPEENFVPRLKSIAPKLLIVDTREGLDVRKSEGDHHHHHEDGTCCGSDGIDPHIWMSPAMVKKQADVILKTLIEMDPSHEKEFRESYTKFVDELTELQNTVHEKLDSLQGKTLFVYHPSYGYFCDEFGLNQKAIEVEGKSPTPRKLADWIKTVQDDQIRAIIVQPEFNQSAAQTISGQTEVALVVHSPLEQDYYNCIRSLADIIVQMHENL